MADQRGQTRRHILKGAIGAAAGLVLGAPVRAFAAAAAQSSDAAGTLRLSDDLFVIRIPGEANVVAHSGADGIVLVDGGSAGASEALMKTIAALPGAGPVH